LIELLFGSQPVLQFVSGKSAAQTIRGQPRELVEMQGADELDALPGIGADLAGKITRNYCTRAIFVLSRSNVSRSHRAFASC
jgi:hypothetical protein